MTKVVTGSYTSKRGEVEKSAGLLSLDGVSPVNTLMGRTEKAREEDNQSSLKK